jgi:hypothetical protein
MRMAVRGWRLWRAWRGSSMPPGMDYEGEGDDDMDEDEDGEE